MELPSVIRRWRFRRHYSIRKIARRVYPADIALAVKDAIIRKDGLPDISWAERFRRAVRALRVCGQDVSSDDVLLTSGAGTPLAG